MLISRSDQHKWPDILPMELNLLNGHSFACRWAGYGHPWIKILLSCL